LRQDPLLAMLSGKSDLEGEHRRRQDRGKAGAGKSTLNRLELSRLLVDLYIQAQPRQPQRIVLDLDATDDPVHGQQEGRFFHGYYGGYCYLPLYIFIGEHLVCARLRPSNMDASAGALEEIQRIVGRLRRVWPGVEIVLRADSGFGRDAIRSWCEQNRVGYVFGLAKNERLLKRVRKPMQQARRQWEQTGKPARAFTEFRYRTRESWSRARRVVAQAEYLDKGENPRFVVTSWSAERMEARPLYEQFYCARGDMENRIKEQQLALFADRTSTSWMRSNQIRLYCSSIAYCLRQALRRLGLAGTGMAKAQCRTIRPRLLKIGAQVRLTVRKIWISLAASHPASSLFRQVYYNLMGAVAFRR
jgi:hypothetical protein